MRRDSTEEDAALPVCAVAVAVQRNCIHCEGSQWLFHKQLFSPAHLWAHSLITSNQHAGKLWMLQPSCQEQPGQQSWCFYLVSWKKAQPPHNAALARFWHQFTEKSGLCATPPSSNVPSVSRASLKIPPAAPQTQWMVPISTPCNMAAKALSFLQGAPETWNP